MGDRSNIVVQEHNGNRIFLYGHWMGEDAINVVAEVLAQRERWNDSSYFTRMLFNKMTEGSPKDSTTGFGISTYMCDNEYPIIILDFANQEAFLEQYKFGENTFTAITPRVSFEEMLNACSYSESYEQLAVAMGAKLVAP